MFELRCALRAVARTRGTAVVAILTLGLGIGATTTLFSVAYAALLRGLPFPDSDRLVMLYVTRETAAAGTAQMRWPPAKIMALEASARSFQTLGTYISVTVAVGDPDPEEIDAEIASAGYLSLLHASPIGGRTFLEAEDRPGHAVVVVSAALWRRRYGSDTYAAGRSLLVNSTPLTIVGVLPDGFRGLSGRAELWLPPGLAPQLTYRDYLMTPQHFINLIGRLAAGVTLAQANAELSSIGPQLPRTPAPNEEPARWSAAARPLNLARVDPGLRRSVLLLFAGVGCVLLVTCVNVAALLLARARARRHEMAVRRALGAGRVRIARQMIEEAALLAAAGGGLGVLLAAWGVTWFQRFSPTVLASPQNDYAQLSSFASPAVDGVALVCALVLTLGTTVLVGAVPALSLWRSDPSTGLAGGGRGTSGPGSSRALSALAVAQVSLAVLLVSAALLLAATVDGLQEGRSALDARVLTFWVNPPASRYADESGPAIVERILDAVTQVPGVAMAAVNRCTPFDSRCARTTVFFPGRPAVPRRAPVVGRHYVSEGYFGTLGIALRRGRLLNARDRAGAAPVAVVNEAAARRFWPGEDPVGKRVWFGSAPGFTDPEKPVEVVGVVADVKYWPLDEPAGPDFYTSYLQFTYPSTLLLVKSAGDPRGLVPGLRAAVANAAPQVPVYDVKLMDDRVSGALARPRLNAVVTAMFGATVTALAAMGIYGVLAYGISVRRREIAIRVALGATPHRVRTLVVAQGVRLAIVGAVIGLGLGAWTLRLMSGMLYGVRPADPRVLGAATCSMLAVAVLASIVPSWRASRTDPMVVLRAE